MIHSISTKIVPLSMRFRRSIGLVSRATEFRSLRSFSTDSMRDSRETLPNFNDSKIAFQSKTILSLLRADVVFSICRIPFLVSNAESILKGLYRFLGNQATNTLLRYTYFGHFCAGEDAQTIQPTVSHLQQNGVGSILDYAAENDTVPDSATSSTPDTTEAIIAGGKEREGIQCRVYSYKDEALCDMHVETFEKCIRAVAQVSPTGFAAIKITALGNPMLLQRVSEAAVELRNLFTRFDLNNSGLVGREPFLQTYAMLFSDDGGPELFTRLDSDRDGAIDYIDWTNSLPLEELHVLTKRCRNQGPLALATLSAAEVELFASMRRRVGGLAELAASLGVRLMVDAEHAKFQPAIDNITVGLAKRFNRKSPVIFGTYQMYLRDTRGRLEADMRRSHEGGYHFACKLVRGAYMTHEREAAESQKRPDPVHPTIEDTHSAYNSATEYVITAIAEGRNVELMIATHNQRSVELALNSMQKHGLQRGSRVYFGQLLGMSDHLTFSLGAAGFQAYKYVPYGRVQEVMPYLVRRAQENSGMLGGASLELRMIRAELKRRLTA